MILWFCCSSVHKIKINKYMKQRPPADWNIKEWKLIENLLFLIPYFKKTAVTTGLLGRPSFCPGGYSIYAWVGRCGAATHTLTLFKTNIADFPTLFRTELRFLNTLFKTFNPNIN